jgi:hypothetical protein
MQAKWVEKALVAGALAELRGLRLNHFGVLVKRECDMRCAFGRS